VLENSLDRKIAVLPSHDGLIRAEQECFDRKWQWLIEEARAVISQTVLNCFQAVPEMRGLKSSPKGSQSDNWNTQNISN